MFDQMQVSTPDAPLSALLEHPEFQVGLALAQEYFLDRYEQAPLSEEEMIEEVETSVTLRVTEREKTVCRRLGWEPTSYFYTLGFVVGTINVGLTYAR